MSTSAIKAPTHGGGCESDKYGEGKGIPALIVNFFDSNVVATTDRHKVKYSQDNLHDPS